MQSNLPEQPLDRAKEEPDRTRDDASPFDLQQFTPLILMDGLQRATEALERGDAPLAARTVEQVIASKPLEQAPAWQYLLARLYEQAGEVAPAVRAYQTSAAYSWTLTGYAQLGAGRVLLRAGNPKGALLELEKIPDEEPLKSAAALLTANAALSSGDSVLAVERLRAYLAREKLPDDWGAAAVLLSRSLLARNPTVGTDANADDPRVTELLEALKWARKAQLAPATESADASELEAKILHTLPPKVQADVAALSVDESTERLGALLRTRKYSATRGAADELLVRLGRERFGNQGCEAQLIRARALGGEGLWGKAVDTLSDPIAQCADPDQHANLLYLAGKSAFADKRYSAAIQFFSRLESDAPKHQLADDARLYGALAYRELGVEARFTELLSTMAEEYPDGDMTLEGVFRLAVRQLEKRDFSTAVQVLERALQVQGPPRKKARIEELGREQYFLARARIESGEVERGLSEYEQLIRAYPLSYYMLHAFTRLYAADPSRAEALLRDAQQRGETEPFLFDLPRGLDQVRFNRALELLRVGEVDAASRELAFMGLDKPEVTPSLLWGTALLYQRAGAARASSQTAKLLQPEWLQRWPTGDWVKAWQLAYPRPYERIVSQEASKSGVPEALIYAVMREESAFDPEAVSPANAYGLMQLIEPTARHYAKDNGIPSNPRALRIPWVNIALGSRVLSKFSGMFPENSLLAVPGYNAGPGRPKQWLRELGSTDFDVWVELIPFRETRHYTKRVLASRATYDYLYGAQDARALLLPLKLN